MLTLKEKTNLNPFPHIAYSDIPNITKNTEYTEAMIPEKENLSGRSPRNL